MTDKEAREKLVEIKARDITGGLRLLDCAHDFRSLFVVIVPDKEMRLLMGAPATCGKCEQKFDHVISDRIDCCPYCGVEYKPGYAFTGQMRNYVIGRVPAIDKALLECGAFDEILGKMAEQKTKVLEMGAPPEKGEA